MVHPLGCPQDSTYSSCATARGGVFTSNESSTWDYVGLYSLWIEQNLGLKGDAYYGYDAVGLMGLGEGGPTLKNTTVGDFAVDTFYLGYFGLNPKPTNWSSFQDSAPSYMTQLKEQNLIPSVSFGYTAGAIYRFTGVLASLTLGGYDESRFEANDVEFTFAADNERDTVVAIQSILTSDSNTTNTNLLPDPIYALVDASVAQMWLPLAACQMFESEFGLIHDPTTDLYLVNSSLHSDLLARNASFTFTLAQGTTAGPAVNITLPYAAFDLTASPPYQGLENSTTYFPLRRAANDSQYTLGRFFFQEAFISVDYERSKFNISQCTWEQSAAAQLIAIPTASPEDATSYSGNTTPAKASSSGLSTGAIVGIAIGAVAVIVIVAGLLIWHFRRRRQHAKAVAAKSKSLVRSHSDSASSSGDSATVAGVNDRKTAVFPKAELEGTSKFDDNKNMLSPTSPTSQGYSTYRSSNGTLFVSPTMPSGPTGGVFGGEVDGLEVYEMPGDMPEMAQADGREMTEKDMMNHRAEQYNGVDSHRSDEDPATADENRKERQLLSPDQVRDVRVVDPSHRYSFVEGDDSEST